MKLRGRKWRYERRQWQATGFGLRLFYYDLYEPTGYRKRMK